MKLGCLCESYFYVGFFFFFWVILGVTFSGILTVLYSITMVAYLAGFLFAFNTVATNWEMLMPGRLIRGKGTALKKDYNEADVKMMVNFVTFYSTRSYPVTVLKLWLKPSVILTS